MNWVEGHQLMDKYKVGALLKGTLGGYYLVIEHAPEYCILLTKRGARELMPWIAMSGFEVVCSK